MLQVTVKHRTGEDDFIGCIRRGLAAHYGASQPIGVGGVFRINTGDIHAHVMPDFSAVRCGYQHTTEAVVALLAAGCC